MNEIGERLKEALTEIGVTLAEAAKRSEIPYRSLQNYTTPSPELAQQPGAEALMKLRKAFGISIDWLLTGEGEKFVQSVTFVPREITMMDYQELRVRFTNFDEVFKIKNPWEFADNKPTAEGDAEAWRHAIRFTAEQAKLDLAEFLDGRSLETMSNEELKDAAMSILKLLPSRQ